MERFIIRTRKTKPMKNRYILFQRSGIFYSEDTTSGKQKSLRTRIKADASRPAAVGGSFGLLSGFIGFPV